MTIKTMREASGMTQKAFAEYFGIPKRTVENWEARQRECPSYLLELMVYKLKNEGIIKAVE
jgi:DNA-binding transcriptional regulator YiaG